MGVYKRKGKQRTSYFYQFEIDGVTYKQTVKSARNKAQALRAETKAREEVYNRTYRPPDKSPKIEAFIADVYLPWAKGNKASWQRDTETCAAIMSHFAGKRLRQIGPDEVEDFIERRKNTPVVKGKQSEGTPRRPATVNRELSVLSKIFTLAVRKGKVEANPCRAVEPLAPDNATLRWLSVEEERRLMKYLVGERDHLRPIVVLYLHTGMRRSELLTLRRHQISFEQGTITLPKTKTPKKSQTKSRVIPINSIAREELAQLCQGLGELEYLFTNSRTGGRLKDPKRAFSTACRLAGIKGVSIHKLRHTFGTRLAEAGESLHRIAELMGHSDIRTTMKYVHAAAAGKHAAVERLVGYAEKKSTESLPKAERPPKQTALTG